MLTVLPGPLSQGLADIISVIHVSAYQSSIMEGLVASMGGLDASLSNAASSAIVNNIEGAGNGDVFGDVFGCLLRLWQQQGR